MSAPLSLAEKLALWKWLSEALAALHKNDLVPQGKAQMTPGERLAVKFGGRLAAWVSLPQPTQPAARVADERKLLTWAKVHYPERVEYVPEVVMDAGLVEFLQEHRPQSLRTAERVDRQLAEDICAGLAGEDHRYVTAAGEVLTEVPGIRVPEASQSSPRVNLQDDAAEVIAAAWPQLQADLREVLALPAGPQEAPDAA
jgi:hypothetical protein